MVRFPHYLRRALPASEEGGREAAGSKKYDSGPRDASSVRQFTQQ